MNSKFPEVLVIENNIFKDDRGYFLESFNRAEYIIRGIDSPFCQDNISYSRKGTLRGLHFQTDDFAQGKLLQVISGQIYDVVADIRKDSATFGQWAGIKLNINKQIYVPPGFAHGFLALKNSIILYKCTNYYSKQSERTIIWNDPNIGIDWPIKDKKDLIISEKDKLGIRLKYL